jgi:chorismate dehydratase
MEYKKSVPAKINNLFEKRIVDAAFISSIEAKRYKNVKLGIIARKDVKSVLVIPDTEAKKDKESATSNVLVNVLGLSGEVLIGDKALRYALANDNYIDLAKVWNERYKLPFVFAVLALHKDIKVYKKIEKLFGKRPVRIPQYLLEKAANSVGIDKKDVLEYLQLISYELDQKAQRGLNKFYKEAAKII